MTDTWPALILLFFIGASVGSFAGFLAARWPVSGHDLMDRSKCDGCGRRLSVWQLVPFFGYFASVGRCGTCKTRIPILYPALELAGGLVGLSLVWPGLPIDPFYVLGVGWVLLVLTAIDARTFLLPDWGTLGLVLAGLGAALLDPQWVGPLEAATGAAAGYTVIALIALTYRHLRGMEGIGMGDAKLLAAAGAWLGPWILPQLLLIASLSGLIAAGLIAMTGRKLDGQTAIPFGPFLSVGFYLCLLEPDLLNRMLGP